MSHDISMSPWSLECDRILVDAAALDPDDHSDYAEHLRDLADLVDDARAAN